MGLTQYLLYGCICPHTSTKEGRRAERTGEGQIRVEKDKDEKRRTERKGDGQRCVEKDDDIERGERD